MKKLCLVLFIHGWLTATAQSDSLFMYEKTIQGDIVSFAVDNLDNLYLLNSGNQLKKLNAAGDSLAVFNDVKRFGQATYIDVSNPLKVLLYYRSFASVVMLDRLLNVRNTIDLRRSGILQARAIGQSYDNKVWVYDELENKLKKIDEDGKLLQETPDFRQLFGEAPSPQLLFDQEQLVYLYDSAKAIFVFDYYGSLKKKIPVSGWQNVQVTGRFIFGSRGDTLYRYDIRSFQTDEWPLPPALRDTRIFHFTNTRFYALKKDGIEIYRFR